MRVVFMGTPSFAAQILEELRAHFEVVGVFTKPDAVRGRGKKLEPSPVKSVALQANIPVYEPQSFKDDESFQQLEALRPDIICVAAYGKILPRRVLELPPHGCINVHASLLPRWRGAAPIERAILAGDEEVGVCIMRMEEGLDTGAYCVRRSIPVDERNAAELTEELSDLGGRALISALNLIEAGADKWVEQDESIVTYAHKLEKEELFLNPALSVHDNLRRIRASSKAHPARCIIEDDVVTINTAHIVDHAEIDVLTTQNLNQAQGFMSRKRLILGCSDGAFEVNELTPSGKKLMTATSFVAGKPQYRNSVIHWDSYEN